MSLPPPPPPLELEKYLICNGMTSLPGQSTGSQILNRPVCLWSYPYSTKTGTCMCCVWMSECLRRGRPMRGDKGIAYMDGSSSEMLHWNKSISERINKLLGCLRAWGSMVALKGSSEQSWYWNALCNEVCMLMQIYLVVFWLADFVGWNWFVLLLKIYQKGNASSVSVQN